MNPTLTKEEFLKMRALLARVCGISLEEDQGYLVETRLTEVVQDLRLNSFGELHDLLKDTNNPLWQRVIDFITTHETFWFRDQSCWITLKHHILPTLFKLLDEGHPKIYIWSAGCSTGQESYSLAILIDELSQQMRQSSYPERFSIWATDISLQSLRSAEVGSYDAFNTQRGLTDDRKKKYFIENNGTWRIQDFLKKE